MNDVQAVVKGNRAVARDTFLMDLECALEPSLPGQFLMVKVSGARELFLRRPLAILGQGQKTLEILYKLKGGGTLELSRKKPGDVLYFPDHVALYLGGGRIVHASTARTGIKYGYANYKPILTIRRIVG